MVAGLPVWAFIDLIVLDCLAAILLLRGRIP